MLSTRSYFLDRKLPINLKRKLLDFANVLHKIFHCKRIEWPSNFRFDEFNQIQSHSKLVPLPNWTYQTLGTNASMPPLWFCRSKNISCLNSARTDTLLVESSSYTFLDAREGNDRQTVDGNNSIKSKAPTEYLCRWTYNVFHSKRMSKHLRWEWKIKSNSPRSPFIVVVVISKFFAKIFLTSSNSKDRELSTGNIQPNAELIL